MTDPSSEKCYAILALSLHGSLDGIDWRQNHSKACRSQTRKDGFDQRRKLLHKGVTFQESQNTRIGRGVAKARYRSLDERSREALVVSCPTTVCVERLDRFGGRCSVAVLVVHDCSQRLWAAIEHCHQCNHLATFTMRVKTWKTIARYKMDGLAFVVEYTHQTLTCGTTQSTTESTLESLAQVELGRPRVSKPQ